MTVMSMIPQLLNLPPLHPPNNIKLQCLIKSKLKLLSLIRNQSFHSKQLHQRKHTKSLVDFLTTMMKMNMYLADNINQAMTMSHRRNNSSIKRTNTSHRLKNNTRLS